MGEQNEYSEIHLRVEKQTMRDIKAMCNLQRIGGQAVMTGEAWVKVFKAIQKGEGTFDLILKEYIKEGETPASDPPVDAAPEAILEAPLIPPSRS